MTTRAAAGVAVLLVYGARIPTVQVLQDDRGSVIVPGMRITVQRDGAAWVQPVGYEDPISRDRALFRVHRQCLALDLIVEPLPIPGQPPGIVVRRGPNPQLHRRYSCP